MVNAILYYTFCQVKSLILPSEEKLYEIFQISLVFFGKNHYFTFCAGRLLFFTYLEYLQNVLFQKKMVNKGPFLFLRW